MRSSVPMATTTSSGSYAAVDLGLHGVSGGFEAANPLVPLRIPKHGGKVRSSSAIGVSLTPVDSQGVSLGGAEGVNDGETVDFTGTQDDTDTILKPTSLGVDVAALLRSVNSPDELYYKVGLPQGSWNCVGDQRIGRGPDHQGRGNDRTNRSADCA